MSNMGALGNFEEFLRPFLGRIVFTDRVHGSTRVGRDTADDYGSIHPLHHRFSGDRRTLMVSDGLQLGHQRKTQGYRFAGTSGNQRDKHDTAQGNGNRFSGAFSTAATSRRCSSPKIPFPKLALSCWDRDFACFPSAKSQFISSCISNTQLEFRDSENDVCRTLRNASARLVAQSSNQTLNHKPRPGFGRGWNVREIRMKGWI
jgi:hypothetical protein